MTSSQSMLRVTRDGGVMTVTLCLPERLNPLRAEMQEELRSVLAGVHDDRSVRALVLTGSGRAFCVGADLSGMNPEAVGCKSLGQWTGDVMESTSNPLILDLRSLPVPTLAAVNGPAAGAGVGLALACDVVIAARSAYFYLPFAPRLGVVPDLGATWFLPRMAGRARAMGMTLIDERIPAEQALEWGLIWNCVEDSVLADTVHEAAQRLAALPPGIIVEIRAAYDRSESRSLADQLAYEAGRQRELIDRDAFREGVAAFLAKRPPKFGER